MKKRPGQALVEFALVFPLLFLLLSGVIDFGFIFHEYLELHHAAREGGRLACVGVDNSSVTSRVFQILDNGWDQTTITTLTEETDQGTYYDVSFTVSARLLPITPLAGFVPGIAEGIPAMATATFRKE